MIQRRELRDTSRDIDEYQSFRETFQDEDKVLSDGVRLAKETQRLQDVLGDHEVSHAVQLREASDQNPPIGFMLLFSLIHIRSFGKAQILK